VKRSSLAVIGATAMFCIGIYLVARVVAGKLDPAPDDAPAAVVRVEAPGMPKVTALKLHQECFREANCGVGQKCLEWKGLPVLKQTCEIECEPARDQCPTPSKCVTRSPGPSPRCE
jgi:hypothetical protein